jgi:dTDP-4-dehydrorhamnose reductase
VSPTYVPHLVNASLDLLIDGSRGIWHLANVGALTWYDFACAAAAAGGRSAEDIRPVATSEVWGPAARPPFSALSSARGLLMPPLADALTAFTAIRRIAASAVVSNQ